MSKELLKRDFTDIFPSFFNEGAKWLRGFNSEFDKILNGKCDFEDRDNEYYIELETPGVEKNEININFKNDNLVVNWSRTREEKKGKSDKSRYERSSGSFQRSFNVEGADFEKIEAELKNGVLKITIPKLEKVKAKQITIK
ncbi:MAG TPA: Hsp20/alpha crystallin family protein [Spirochaetota bacterium]|jgi:HSP20 family protein|nr:MAG: 18 kDa heat shock protein [Spirochaetes bacterium ADurb.Bin133]HNZ25738.1 Hsp20/alpha crystallin family protein [Spirochaetota bacterium]HOF00873.1 Hsp20/alpha crystallin family protein [Spirochaetota bacterium]HOS32748.1 Hsp20/alpha crystallin family protein [Spirochaetota bacterium]HOS55285.1 Hsp20/alpha crystallin family protein [Spirochaetota bacterium]